MRTERLLSHKSVRKQWNHKTLAFFPASALERGPLGSRSDQLPWSWLQLPGLLPLGRGEHFPWQVAGENASREGETEVFHNTVTPPCHPIVVTMSSFTHQKLLFTYNHLKGRAYNFARAQRRRKRENNVSPNLLWSSLLPNPGVLIPPCFSDQTL